MNHEHEMALIALAKRMEASAAYLRSQVASGHPLILDPDSGLPDTLVDLYKYGTQFAALHAVATLVPSVAQAEALARREQ